MCLNILTKADCVGSCTNFADHPAMVNPVRSRKAIKFASIAARAFLLRNRVSLSMGMGGSIPGARDTRPMPTDLLCPGTMLARGHPSPARGMFPFGATLERRIASDGRARTAAKGACTLDSLGIPFACVACLFVSMDASVMRRCDMATKQCKCRKK